MKFYNRTHELSELERIKKLAIGQYSRLTVISGRRRTGKTALVMKSVEADTIPTVYLFIGRKKESTLCNECVLRITKAFGTRVVAPDMQSFHALFRYLMEYGTHTPFNLIIDEFQEFQNINTTIYGDIQALWDEYRLRTRINFVVCGSVFSVMQKLFQSEKGKLFDRADYFIKLSAFDLATMKMVLADHNPLYTNEDLLAFYVLTGGVPKYIELFCDNGALDLSSMLHYMISENSPFIDEGRILLVEELGKHYATYFSILNAIAIGQNTQAEIEEACGNQSIGGQLKRLIEGYDIIARQRPILARDTNQARYEIKDNFMRFWFRYFDRNRSLIELKNYAELRALVADDYTDYSEKVLARYFRQQFSESFKYRVIGSWWEPQNETEIDVVGVKPGRDQAIVGQVKRQKEAVEQEELAAKVEYFKQKVLPKYIVETVCLSIDDM
jgi:AAA+ ATPase superfamily predicted ATPase